MDCVLTLAVVKWILVPWDRCYRRCVKLQPEDARRLRLLRTHVNTVFTADHADSSYLLAQLGIYVEEKIILVV
jgi:hypothetical protein